MGDRVAALEEVLGSASYTGLSPSNRRLFLKRIGFDTQVASLEVELGNDWRDLLTKARDSNSAPEIPLDQRRPQERAIFRQALDVARSYGRLQTLKGQALGEGAPATPPPTAELALETLADGRYDEALGLFARIDHSTVFEARAVLAAGWLRQARQSATTAAERRRLAERITRIGHEEARDEAARLLSAGAPSIGGSVAQLGSKQQWVLIGILLVIAAAIFLAFSGLLSPSTLSPTTEPTGTTPTTESATATGTPGATPATPTPPPPTVESVDPPELSAQESQLAVTISGTSLDQAQARTIICQDGRGIEFTETVSPEKITLSFAPLTLNTQRLYCEVRFGDLATGGFTLLAGPAVYTVQGVLVDYKYTGKINTGGANDPSTLLFEQADRSSGAVGSIRNGEVVEVLDSSVEGWFQVRVRSGLTPELVGWAERWLILNSQVPPKPTVVPTLPPKPTPKPAPTAKPTEVVTGTNVLSDTGTVTDTTEPPDQGADTRAAGFVATVVETYNGTNSSANAMSCVLGKVLDKQGAPIKDAVVEVNNGKDKKEQQNTDSEGNYQICSLAAGDYSVVLFYAPGRTIPAGGVSKVVRVSGESSYSAIMNFQEQ